MQTARDVTGKMGDTGVSRFVARHYLVIAGAIVLMAIGLRIHGLGATSLWVDEAIFTRGIHTTFDGMLAHSRHTNSSPIVLPLVYWLLGDVLWTATEVRALPMVFGVLAVGAVLALPRVGVPVLVSALAALLLAVNPHQVEYSQEVRQYSLAALLTCMLIYAFLAAIRTPSRAHTAAFAGVCFIAPLTAYGTIFMALALLAAGTAHHIATERKGAGIVLAPALALGVGMLLSWLITARFQLHMPTQAYLAGYYPPPDASQSLAWTVKSLGAYFKFAMGSTAMGLTAVALLGTGIGFCLFAKPRPAILPVLLAALAVLVAGSLSAAFLGLYPFGGLRNHLFATPLVVLCATWCALVIAQRLRRAWSAMATAGIAAYLVSASAAALPRVYEERQDIVSAVTVGLQGVPDEEVYAFSPAELALGFHFPDRRFVVGSYMPGKIEAIAREASERIGGCKVHLLFTHIYEGQDQRIIEWLVEHGFTVTRDQPFTGARVTSLTRCAPGA
jgi:uncharacterized membrane protein